MASLHQSAEQWLTYYESAAKKAGAFYYGLKTLQIVGAGAIPILLNGRAGDALFTLVASGLGAFIVAAEGSLQLFQFHRTYVNFQDAAERIRIEAYLATNRAAPYASLDDSGAASLLAERIGRIAIREHGRWGRIVDGAKPAERPDEGKPAAHGL